MTGRTAKTKSKKSPGKAKKRSGIKNQFSYPKTERTRSDFYLADLPDGKKAMIVETFFAIMSCQFHPDELREQLTDHVQALMNTVIEGTKPEDIERYPFLEITEVAYNAGVRYSDSKLQELLLHYSDFAFEAFTKMVITKMYDLPELLVEQILYSIMVQMEKDKFLRFKVKSGPRKMWDDLKREYGKSLMQDWKPFKPGPSEVTSRAERAAMMAFYDVTYPICQSAKGIYKQNKRGDWRAKVKEKHPDLDDADIEHLVNTPAFKLAYLITGKHFGKVIGRNEGGIDEVERQIKIARKEAKENSSQG